MLGSFKPSPEHPGFPDKRWLTLAELKASESLEVAHIKTKLAEYQAATQAAANAELDAAPAPSRACSGLRAGGSGLRGPEGHMAP